MRIIRTAKKLNKPVVATGDVHYANRKKNSRDIYIQTQDRRCSPSAVYL
ncbi:MAG: hypothetical protein ACLSA6_16945 [Holdemania massiliensis]